MKRLSCPIQIIILLLITLALYTCIEPDYFSQYDNENLISHLDFSDWTADQESLYMNWEEVSSTDAGGTTGLTDSSATIYRLEMNNLVPDGDFETSTTIADAGWTTNGTLVLEDNSDFNSRALGFDFSLSGDSAAYLLSQLSDGAVNNSSYLFRFDLTADGTGTLTFNINSTYPGPFNPSIENENTIYNIPDDFQSDEIPLSEFTINDNSVDSFSIDLNIIRAGAIDNFRIVKTDQEHYARLAIAYTDTERVGGLQLIDGTYRFSIYVKADPQAGSDNHYSAEAVTLMIESVDSVNPSSPTTKDYFSADDYDDFSEWTELTIDLETQISKPEDDSSTVINLSVCPGNATSTSTLDACSILISSPGLYYSEDGLF